MIKLIEKLFGYRYFTIFHMGNHLEVRSSVFGRVQYLKYDTAIQLARKINGEKDAPEMCWVNMLERNKKSNWVKQYENI